MKTQNFNVNMSSVFYPVLQSDILTENANNVENVDVDKTSPNTPGHGNAANPDGTAPGNEALQYMSGLICNIKLCNNGGI